MMKSNFEAKDASQMNESLKPLQISQLEERLEVSYLVPSGDVVEGNFFDGDYCCHNKCNGNDINIDDPIDTGEIPGGREV